MIFSLAFIYIVMYLYFLKTVKYKNVFEFFLINTPIFIIIIMLLGLQYEVGTDYYSYLKIADGTKSLTRFYSRNEFFFVYVVLLVKSIGTPQYIFLFIGIIQVVFLFLTAYEVNKMGYKLYIFFFLYFTLALLFFNQFNGIRQYTAIYIVVYAFIKLKDNKPYSFIILVIAAALFHSSAIYLIPFVIARKFLYKKIDANKAILFIFALFLMYLIFFANIINFNAIINKLLSFTSYSNYIGREYIEPLKIRSVLTKLPKILIVLTSTYVLNRDKEISLNKNEVYLVNMSYIACSILVLSFLTAIIWRVYQYVDLFLLIPVLILFSNKGNSMLKFSIVVTLVLMLSVKILLLPEGEYLYKSILLN